MQSVHVRVLKSNVFSNAAMPCCAVTATAAALQCALIGSILFSTKCVAASGCGTLSIIIRSFRRSSSNQKVRGIFLLAVVRLRTLVMSRVLDSLQSWSRQGVPSAPGYLRRSPSLDECHCLSGVDIPRLFCSCRLTSLIKWYVVLQPASPKSAVHVAVSL